MDQDIQSQGWNLLRSLNEGMEKLTSVELRRLLASYMNLHVERPSKLHSAVLSIASRMAVQFPDFHFVPFLNLWGLENLRPEDSEIRRDERSGKSYPALVEQLCQAYAYSQLFHPEEHLDDDLETLLKPHIQKLGIIPTSVGYVEFIDEGHQQIHVYDKFSRHFVAKNTTLQVPVGQYVEFVTIIPKQSKFKSAIIYKVYSSEEGADEFGFRQAKVTYVDSKRNFVSWELTDGTTIIEAGTNEPSYTKGYISEQLIQKKGLIPKVGDILNLIVFLKRGKDGQKHPFVVNYQMV